MTNDTDAQLVERLSELEKRATPGEWYADEDREVHPTHWRGVQNTKGLAKIAAFSPWDGHAQDDRDAMISAADANLALTVAARNSLPASSNSHGRRLRGGRRSRRRAEKRL